MGNVVNGETTSSQTLTVRFDVVVRNVVGNQRGTSFNNRASFRFENAAGQFVSVNSNSVSSTIRAPSLRMNKTASPLTAIGDETITFTVEVENQSVSNAGPVFDVRVTDPLAAYYGAIASVGWVITGAGVGITDNTSGSTFDVTIDRLDPGEKVVFTFESALDEFIPHGTTVPNTSTVTGTSVPGEHGTRDAHRNARQRHRRAHG